jgi:hypothetical protein
MVCCEYLCTATDSQTVALVTCGFDQATTSKQFGWLSTALLNSCAFNGAVAFADGFFLEQRVIPALQLKGLLPAPVFVVCGCAVSLVCVQGLYA